MQQFSRPPSTSFFLSEPNIPEGPEYEKYQYYIDVREKFYQLNAAQRQLLLTLNNLEKRILQKKREPTIYENSRLGFIESVESATILTPPSTGFSGIPLKPEPNILKGPDYEKISTLPVDIIYLDFKKAFDNIPREKLLPKRIEHRGLCYSGWGLFLLEENNDYLSTVKFLNGPLSSVVYHRAVSLALWFCRSVLNMS